MGATAERGFPLDVDHPFSAGESLGSNPGRAAEAEVTQVIHRRTKVALFYGATAPKLAQALERAARTVPDQPGPQCRQHANLEAALHQAAALAAAGDVVLLSPACASYDMFQDFQARGDAFMAAIRKLLHEDTC